MYDFRAKQTYLLVIFFLLGISIDVVRAQEVEMSQYWATPLDVNPAMAGISYGPRASVNYRNQWAGLGDGFNGGFTTYMASVDGYIPKAKSGIGLMYTGDYVANG
ncbi:MAG TPA: type IX secretion system membrane protein PorP/SprF, partial [Chitinophagales bacterium]